VTGAIQVVDHDPEWAKRFEAIRAVLADALSGVNTRTIEHVGSTSVAGLAAKPIIDIDVVVAERDAQAAIDALEAPGYECVGTMGIPGRFAMVAPPGTVRQNTYVMVDGCLALRNHLGVREVLRREEGLRDRYAAVKRELAARTDDIDVYVEGKSAILREVLAAAGLGDEQQREIEDLNRPTAPR